jgi:hypothetical protein
MTKSLPSRSELYNGLPSQYFRKPLPVFFQDSPLAFCLPSNPASPEDSQGGSHLKRFLLLILAMLLSQVVLFAQTSADPTDATKIIQPAQSTVDASSTAQRPVREVKIPAGTLIEVEVAYTVDSIDIKPGERISFRALIPVMIDGVTVVEKDALVTARVTQAKRGGHWGRAGRLAWSMEDVVATDNTRIPLAPETGSRDEKLWSLEKKKTSSETAMGQGRVKGTSHSGQVAAMSILSGALFPPLALMGGFKRGENAILREGRRFVVSVARDAVVKGIATPQ